MAAPIPKGQSNTYGTPAPIAVPEAKNATAQPLKAPASAAFMPAPTMPGFSARTSTTPGAIQPSAPPIPQAAPQAPPGSPPVAPAAPAAPTKPSQAPLPPTAPKGAPVAPKTPPVAPAPSTGFVSTDPEVQRRIAEIQKQVMAQSSFGRVDAPSGTEAAKNANAAIKNLGAPYLTTDSKATIEAGFSPSQTGIVTTKGYTTARNELDSAIRTTESNPIDQVTSETEKMLSGIIKANTDEYNRLTGLAGEFDAENNPTFQLLQKRQMRIAARMEEAIQNIQAQTDVDLRAQEKLNKDLEGKARAALNAAGQVGSMVGEGYMAAQMQNNLDALQSIKAAAARAVSDARYAFENEQDEVAFQMVALAENRKKQAQDILEKNADLALKMEGVRMQREQFKAQQLAAAQTREINQLELRGKYETAAQNRLSNLVDSGLEFTPETAGIFLDAAKETGWSSNEVKAYAETVRLKGEDKALERATKFAAFLSNTPQGGTVELGGFSYTVTGKNEDKTLSGVEIDKQTGIGRAWTFNPVTGEKSVTSLGQIGGVNQNREIKEIGGKYWSIDPNDPSNAKPVFASESQEAWEEAFPQGSTGPILPGGDPKNAGQCGAAVNFWAGERIWGNKPEEKIATLNKYGRIPSDEVQVGDTLVERIGTYWHVGVVNQVERGEDGVPIYRFTESNRNGDSKITHDRTLRADDKKIEGFTRIPLPGLPASGPDAPRRRYQLQDELEDQELSINDAEKFGVPFGTRRSEIRGKIPGAPAPAYQAPSFEDFQAETQDQLADATPEELKTIYDNTYGAAPAMIEAINVAAGGLSKGQYSSVTRGVTSAIERGDFQGAREQIKKAAVLSVGTEEQAKIRGRDAGINQLKYIKNTLDEYKRLGGDTSLFRGTEQAIKEKTGKVGNAKLRKIASDIALGLIDYRKAVSGAAFTESEGKQYAELFPSISTEYDLNMAKIESLIDTWNRSNESFYRSTITDSLYDVIYASPRRGGQVSSKNVIKARGREDMDSAPVGSLIDLPDGRRVKKIGDDSFDIVSSW